MTIMTSIVETDPLADESRDYERISRAIAFIVAARPAQPSLPELAVHVGLSPFHLQRMFKRWAGVSPKQFIGYLTLQHAKSVMRQSASVLDTTYEVGLSGPSRLHDLFVVQAAMTPGEYKAQGHSLKIRYGYEATPFGTALILTTDRGICGIDFVEDEHAALTAARQQWPLSQFVEDRASSAPVASHLVRASTHSTPMPLLMCGTNFQIQVWSALMRVPPGAIVSYSDVAQAIGKPTAQRAVGAALASNLIAYAIPCHRVLRATGLFESFKWSPWRRHALLAWEAAHLVEAGAHGSAF
jgi:AraC family transcriptional regulator, regulatory protein of adaptative response / methylated-DNA-[protein]-cysteine methyltransferase